MINKVGLVKHKTKGLLHKVYIDLTVFQEQLLFVKL